MSQLGFLEAEFAAVFEAGEKAEKSWDTKTLGDVFPSVRNGKNVNQDKSGEGFSVSRIETISDGSVDPLRVGYTADEIDAADADWLESGDILFSHINSPERVGHVALYEGSPERLLHGINLLRMRPDPDRVDPKFALHLLRTQGFRGQLRKFVNQAVNQASVSITNLKSIELRIPPLGEQKRIASILDAADELRTKRQQAINQLDTLTQAIFHDMFGAAVERNWPIGRLGNHVATTSGGTPNRKVPELFGGEIPWFKSGELKEAVVYDSEEKITTTALANSSAKLMPAGTVLIAMYGATVGAVSTLGVEAATNQAICCLSPTDEVTGSYLVGYLRSIGGELRLRAAGGAQPNISQKIIRNLDLPLPPGEQQVEYARRIDEVSSIGIRGVSSLKSVDSLFTSLQQRAFRGDL